MIDEPGDSDLRRRAAWLLALLALVAGLCVVLFLALSNSGGDAKTNQAGPDDGLGPTTAAPSTHRSGGSTSASAPSTSSHPSQASCPTSATCSLDYDLGNAVDAVNAYRKDHDQPSVPGKVSDKAAKCALGDGDSSSCSGGWAESQVDKPTGAAAVAKLQQRGKLLDPQMKSFEIGWAYDPRAKQYYVAIIRKD